MTVEETKRELMRERIPWQFWESMNDERKLRTFYEKRTATEVAADALGEEWKGYVVRISGGNDKQGFPMKQGVLTHGRVRLLLSKGHSCYRPKRTGERKHKSVQGCTVNANLSVLNLVIVKKGEKDIPDSLILLNSVLRKIRKRLQNMLNFWQENKEGQRKTPGTDCQETEAVFSESFYF
eukprot:bmy_11386T0